MKRSSQLLTVFLALLTTPLIGQGAVAEETPAFVHVHRSEPGAQGEFLLNGKPFLPLVITMLEKNGRGTLAEKLARSAAAGFNCVQVGGSPAVLRRKLDEVEIWRDYPLLWKGAAELNAELTQALPLLLAPECPVPLTLRPEGDWQALSWNGETGEPLHRVLRQIDENRIACFALGFPAYEATARFVLDAVVPVHTVTRWPTAKAVKMSDNTWSDRFYRGEVQIYLLHY